MTAIYTDLASLFDYPDEGFKSRVSSAAGRVGEAWPSAGVHVARFAASISPLSNGALQELATRTWDLSPECAPWLSVHLFGPESWRRSSLMTGLKESYQKASFEPGNELPDHLAVVLRYAAKAPPEEWADLVRLCVRPALVKMQKTLSSGENPYRHLLDAVALVLDSEASHA